MTSLTPILAQADAAVLLAWWKALLILPPLFFWAWLISSKLEKDARYFHLPWQMWNGIHVAAGVAALAVMVFTPWFFVGWPLGMLILAGPVIAYWQIRNRSVPQGKQFHLSAAGGTLAQHFDARKRARATQEAAIRFTDAKGKERPVPLKDEPLFPVHMMAEDLLGPAIAARASRVEVAVTPKGTAVAQTVDGMKYKREPLPVEHAVRLIDFLKDIACLDVEDRRRPQADDFTLVGPDGKVSVHLVTGGSSNGQVIRAEFDRAKRLSKPYDGLGLLPAQMEAISTLVAPENRHGIVLVGAPPGHGLSTTMYSLLNRHDAYTSNIKTLEKDIEVDLVGVDQTHFDVNNPDVDFATSLQSILRRDPDVVMLGELPDPETAKSAAAVGLAGPLVYIPQRAGSIPEQIRDWVKFVGEVKAAAKPLRAVVNQRLVRSLCPNCRQPYQPSPEQRRRLNLPAKVTQLYRAGGKIQVKNKIEPCPVCGGSGHLGQIGIFEVMVADDEARRLLGASDLKGALAHARRNKMIYLQEAAVARVVSGETTIEEIVRVTSPPGQPRSRKPAAPESAAPAGA